MGGFGLDRRFLCVRFHGGVGRQHRFGFDGRLQYSVTGSVANLACRLCMEARDGEILIDSKVHTAVEPFAAVESAGDLALRGFRRPVSAFRVSPSAAR